MAKPTEHVIDKMVTGYHLMISSGQEIINELKTLLMCILRKVQEKVYGVYKNL